jgi:hypothetical protein
MVVSVYEVVRFSKIGVMYGDSIHPAFPGMVLGVWVSESSVPVSHKIQFMMPNIAGCYKPRKCDISDNVYEDFDFPTMGGNVYESRTAINHIPIGRLDNRLLRLD